MADTTRRADAPYSARHAIPTIKEYKQEKEARQQKSQENDVDPGSIEANYGILHEEADNKANRQQEDGDGDGNYGDGATEGQYGADAQDQDYSRQQQPAQVDGSGHDEHSNDDDNESDVDDVMKDTSEAIGTGSQSAKSQRKNLKKRGDDRAERVVTDPVTHLPLRIHDFTSADLKAQNEDERLKQPEYQRGDSGVSEKERVRNDAAHGQRTHRAMEGAFPPPKFDVIRERLRAIYTISVAVGVGIVALSVLLYHGVPVVTSYSSSKSRNQKHPVERTWLERGISLSSLTAFALGSFWILLTWTSKKVERIWDSGVWEADKHQERATIKSSSSSPESTHWMNAMLGSIWPLINPDLFISLSDTLEDVMQASLPKLVRMISVDDIGQGSEAFRILGIRWLPKGAARHNVTKDGKLQKRKTDLSESDRTNPSGGNMQNTEEKGDNKADQDNSKEENQEDENLAEGLQAEEGDFVNLELAFAFRSTLTTHGMKARSRNPHLNLAFYLPGNIKLPVWVELRGIVGTMRVRLQLTPDPPFFSICTLTFLGQPKVDLSCVPLVKKGLNIMDLPLISNFVQSSVDAAMAEYVAPKSLTLDLKDMLMGDDFKKDTAARGVIVVRIKRATDFKEGDAGFGPFRDGSADGYITVGWAKFGKPMWSSRVIQGDMHPVWDETAYLLVTPQELNVKERLRVQLWDSDRLTADDDLGRVEVDLSEIMTENTCIGKMCDRRDGFRSLKAGEGMPGTLEWSVGYFPKTKLLDEQLVNHEDSKNIKSVKDLEKMVNQESERKLREATKDESDEIEQQKVQDFKERQDDIISSTPPPAEYPSGVLSIVVHQIQGLELETLNKPKDDEGGALDDEKEEGEDLPSSYVSIILNHQKIYMTRTKPKNSRPFFNAGTERFIPDINAAHVYVSVRDARVHEDDPIIGIVDLPLKEVFAKRSQVSGWWPLAGGIGFGNVRISMVFRAVELKVPRELLGWEFGTIDIDPQIKANVPADLQKCKLRIKSNLGSGKAKSGESAEQGIWATKKGNPIRLAVRKRYSSCLLLEFVSTSGVLTDKTRGFAVFWLKDIPDDENRTISLPVWKGADTARAQANVLEDCGEKIGDVELTLRFWAGLSGYHVKYAKRDQNVAAVMEVLDCANDVDDNETLANDSDSSDSDSGDDGAGGDDAGENGDGSNDNALVEKTKNVKNKLLGKGDGLQKDGKRGFTDQLGDYKAHEKSLHRRNRGLMQWKIPRTLNWIQGRVHRGEQKVSQFFEHSGQGSGVETEV